MIKYNKISKHKITKIFHYFFLDFSATSTAQIMGINRNTINLWYNRFRESIYVFSLKEKQETLGGGIYELDESYFGPTRIKGKRGRGAGGKTIVFGLLKRNGKVYTEIIPDTKAKSIIPIIRGKIHTDESTIHTDGWRAYDGLVDIGYEKHYRVHHSSNEFARGKQHINGIESFWSFTKRRLRKFNGIKKEKFHLHLKESEFRYNHRNEDEAKKIIFKNLLV